MRVVPCAGAAGEIGAVTEGVFGVIGVAALGGAISGAGTESMGLTCGATLCAGTVA